MPDFCTTAHLNARRVIVPEDALIQIWSWPYTGDQAYRELQRAHRGRWLFRRHGDHIEGVRQAVDAPDLGGVPHERRLQGQAAWLSLLTERALLRRYVKNKVDIHAISGGLLVGTRRDQTDDLHPIGDEARVALTLPAWMAWRVAVALSTRVIHPPSSGAQVLLTCDVRSRVTLDATCAQLRAMDIEVVGRYVDALRPDPWPELTRPRWTVGRAIRRAAGVLVLEDHRPECAQISEQESWLEPRKENLEWLIGRLIPSRSRAAWREIEGRAERLAQGPARQERIGRVLDFFVEHGLEVLPGVWARLDSARDASTWTPRFEVLPPPRLTFAPGGAQTHERADVGLDTHGPFDDQSFDHRRPRIAVLCEAGVQGDMERFVTHFLDGMPEVKIGEEPYRRSPYAKGFLRRFLLDAATPKPEFFVSQGQSADAYREAARRALRAASERDERWDLVLVQVRGDPHSRAVPPTHNPYHVTKAVFLKRGVPTQEITTEKLCMRPVEQPERLVHILNNVSLACYAKIGGTPWLLPADGAQAREIVVGLGNYEVRSGRIGAPERTVGLCAVFNRHGQYLLDTHTDAVPYEQYRDALLERLREAVETIRGEQRWRERDAVRLVFHAFKPLKDAEVRAVEALMRALSLPHAQHAFVHIEQSHPFLILDRAHAHRARGAWAPQRGCWTELDERTSLLALKGPAQLKRPTDGVPAPLLLRLHRRSSFKDLGYLRRQIFHFACHSWRSVTGSALPVTILYSQLMAEQLRNLREVSDWDDDALLDPIGRTRWFL